MTIGNTTMKRINKLNISDYHFSVVDWAMFALTINTFRDLMVNEGILLTKTEKKISSDGFADDNSCRTKIMPLSNENDI